MIPILDFSLRIAQVHNLDGMSHHLFALNIPSLFIDLQTARLANKAASLT